MANDRWGYERTYNKFITVGDVAKMLWDASAYSEEIEAVSLAGTSEAYKTQMKESYGISDDMIFADLDSVLKKEKFADAIILDKFSIKDFSVAMKILQKGYELFFVKADEISKQDEETKTYATISEWLLGNFNRIVAQADDRFVVVYTDVDTDEYEKRKTELLEDKYSFYASNIIADNLFSTYYNDKYAINLGYYAYENAVRVVVDENRTLFKRENENVWAKAQNVKTSLALIGVGGEDHVAGLSCCYQLADGSFIVIDGGWYEDYEYLYRYLNEKKISKKIIISAWIFTHNDWDHRWCFARFMENYASKVEIEQIIFNFKFDGEDDRAVISIAQNIPGCEIIVAHTGQKMFIRNAVIDVLYSLDSHEFAIRNNNWHSLVFTVEIDGQRTLWLGDVTEAAATVLLKMYGDTLKSDIMQLSHHGIRNGTGLHMDNTYEMYKKIHADIVLWPNHEYNYRKVDNPSINIGMHYWNLAAMLLSKETYFANGRGEYRVFDLPYEYGTTYKLNLQ